MAAVEIGGGWRSMERRQRVSGKWGYIDRTGKMVIPARFLDARSFSDGLAAVRSPEG